MVRQREDRQQGKIKKYRDRDTQRERNRQTESYILTHKEERQREKKIYIENEGDIKEIDMEYTT